VFYSYKDKNQKIFTLPKNVESFADNILFGSIVRLAAHNGYELATTGITVGDFTLSKSDQAWVSGYVHELIEPSESYPSGTSSFVKGRQSAIIERFKVPEKECSAYYKKTKRTIGGVISAISCSKEIYSSRSRLVNLIKETPYHFKVSPSELLKSDEQIREELKISMPFKDTKIFLTYERAYLDSKVQNALDDYAKLLQSVNAYRGDIVTLHKNFEKIKATIAPVSQLAKQVSNLRSSTFFPNGKKKSDQAYRLLSLEDKVMNLQFGKYLQLMDISKLNSRFTWTKTAGEGDLRNSHSPFYVSMLALVDRCSNLVEIDLVRNFVDGVISAIHDCSYDYQDSQTIQSSATDVYQRLNIRLTERDQNLSASKP
jgi:hypothetical protein